MVCTNCGSDTGPAFWATVAAVIVAAIALVIAFREHRVFMRGMGARAKFRVIPSVAGASEPGYTIRTEADTVQVRVVFGLKNDGDKAATATVLNAVVGARARSQRSVVRPVRRGPGLGSPSGRDERGLRWGRE